MKFLERLGRQPVAALVAEALVAVLLLGALDYALAGRAICLFAVVPVLVTGYCAGRGPALLTAGAAASIWVFTALQARAAPAAAITPAWDAALGAAFFVLVGLFSIYLASALRVTREAAGIDGLVGILDARRFYALANAEIKRSSRHHRPFTVAYIDIVDMDAFNQANGAAAGDLLLFSIAETLKPNLRATDFVARFGGDEFIIFLPETGQEPSQQCLAKLEQLLMTAAAKCGWQVQFRLGGITFLVTPNSVLEMLGQIDTQISQDQRQKTAFLHRITTYPKAIAS